MLYQRLSHDNKITKKFCKNLLAEIERSDFIARIERRNQIVKRLREKLFNSYEEEFFSEKLVLGTIKGNKELVRIYQKQAVWENIDKNAGPKRHEGNIVCFQDSDGKTKYGIVRSYGKEKIHLRTANGDKTIHYTQEVYFYTNFHKFSLEIGVSSKSTASKIAIINKVYDLLSDEQKKDDMIPEDMSFVKGFDSKGNIDYTWPEYFGFEKSTIKPITLSLTKDLTRVGSSRGSNLSTRIYSYGALAIPYKENDKSLRMYNFQPRFYTKKN